MLQTFLIRAIVASLDLPKSSFVMLPDVSSKIKTFMRLPSATRKVRPKDLLPSPFKHSKNLMFLHFTSSSCSFSWEEALRNISCEFYDEDKSSVSTFLLGIWSENIHDSCKWPCHGCCHCTGRVKDMWGCSEHKDIMYWCFIHWCCTDLFFRKKNISWTVIKIMAVNQNIFPIGSFQTETVC